jgi:hypothetical protein
MPFRARVGRKNKDFNQSTICYIKDSKRDAFILVKGNEETETELTFLETVKIFEAEVLEKAIALHSQHHEQVQSGILTCFQICWKKKKQKTKRLIPHKDQTKKRQMHILMQCSTWL